MLTHGVSPIDFCLSVIPKNKRANICDSSNYRAIAISILLGNIFDNIIFKDQYKYLSTDALQFGFKDVHPQLFVPLYYWRQLFIIMKIDRMFFIVIR